MRELARADDGSWVVCLVDVGADGPLPSRPGVRRLLTVVDGPVLGIDVEGATHVLEPHRPFAVTADAVVVASVPEGPVRVLDVVVDDPVEPFVTVLELGRSSILPLAGDQVAHVLTRTESPDVVTGPGEVSGRCTVAVVTLQRA
ncbi:HutD family protein [Nocardioides lacusdianchii]|uniref:HutD family protein n=1 Tax=Nocardioides lacusdianchii TaxID=2783664 RepID=UPI001CCAB200|nr:HutD family protein [Nocardioides lacusdianchii]